MTDGRQTQEPDAVPLDVAADAIRRKGARLLVVGVGTKISENGLLEIAEDPSNLFIAQAFENLEKATRDVITSACNETGKVFSSSFPGPLLFPSRGARETGRPRDGKKRDPGNDVVFFLLLLLLLFCCGRFCALLLLVVLGGIF